MRLIEKIDNISSITSRYLIAVCRDEYLNKVTEYLGLSNIKPYQHLLEEMRKKDDILHQKNLELISKYEEIKQKNDESFILKNEIKQKHDELISLKTELGSIRHISDLQFNELSEIHRSRGWRTIVLMRKISDEVFQRGSPQKKDHYFAI